MTSTNACEPGEQLIVLANGDDESDLVGFPFATLLTVDFTSSKAECTASRLIPFELVVVRSPANSTKHYLLKTRL